MVTSFPILVLVLVLLFLLFLNKTHPHQPETFFCGISRYATVDPRCCADACKHMRAELCIRMCVVNVVVVVVVVVVMAVLCSTRADDILAASGFGM